MNMVVVIDIRTLVLHSGLIEGRLYMILFHIGPNKDVDLFIRMFTYVYLLVSLDVLSGLVEW